VGGADVSAGERSVAKTEGKPQYFTGRPCLRGHVSHRRTQDGRCIECWEQKALPSQGKGAEYSAKWRAKYPEREQEVKYRNRYGVELSEIRPRPENCELCGRKHKKIVFDHCHNSGAFRGWICDPCNISLGNVGDSVEILERIIAYLKGALSQ
jgi:hypothetical protein